jgi:hypothetical protein
MITNGGRELISKYLLGQAPQYATHLSIGSGAAPLDLNDELTEQQIASIQAKTVMDFETARIPITSKGFVEDNGITKLSLSAELPKENRYDVTEVALWSAGKNNLARDSDSRMIFNFSEPWEIHSNSISPIPFEETLGSAGDIELDASTSIFSASSSNITLRNSSRTARKEGPRYLNNKIFVRGDTAEITGASGSWEATSASTHIHLNGINFFIGNNSPLDKLKLAFSLINKTALGVEGIPDEVKILIEFYRNEVTTSRGFAKAEIYIDGSEFSGNSYHVSEIPIQDLITSDDFSSSEIRIVRIFVSIIKDSELSDEYYLALDGFRLDNTETENPLYKMVGYSVVKIDGSPIVKFQNTNNYIEFRLNLGI